MVERRAINEGKNFSKCFSCNSLFVENEMNEDIYGWERAVVVGLG